MSYYDTVRDQLRPYPAHLSPVLYHCLQSCGDYWLQHSLPEDTAPGADMLDAGLADVAEQLAPGVSTDELLMRRHAQPIRLRGLGVRRRRALRPAAFAGSFVPAARRFLDWPGSGSGEAWARGRRRRRAASSRASCCGG